ncbi:DUF5675 family protein [Pseudodesulfovibrio thermohalotolerans]|uniref:DUF5675 family protein n=1 Tax=Pseudodesulfovibrio thermohalotolerans TaxID=2880651 RepID=UPI0024424CED|nr:DUF5675 family protein [Pseudodesulfovibrio thermohalotolerans]WFS64018.1 DUF5675 family protein [Pseudodesulfovibrio thermohalotolerans]
MENAYLIRMRTGNEGTFGSLFFGGKRLYTAELPWRDNRSNLSCIPCGTYIVVPHLSRRFGRVYHVLDVPGRSAILLHSGNYAGNSEMGLKTHSHGCILPGLHLGSLGGQAAVLSSRPAITALVAHFGDNHFNLTIEGV